MNDAVQEIWPRMDLGIACAAVSDFRPAVTLKTSGTEEMCRLL